MAARWLSIRIELTGVRGTAVRPSPGRLFAASPDHTFADLAAAVNIAFARWDPHHLYEFVLPDGTCAGDPSGDWGMRADELANAHQLHLDRVLPGQEFRYEFDLAARWTHRCSIDSDPIDPADYFPVLPDCPQPYWGWGAIPDQYACPSELQTSRALVSADDVSEALVRDLVRAEMVSEIAAAARASTALE